MTGPLSWRTAPGYVWGDGCDGWHLCASDALSVIEERMPPGTSEERHFHTAARQVFYVLSGTLTLEVEGEVHLMTAGQSLEIAPKVPHQATNTTGNDVRFLVISSPPAQGDRVAA